FTFNAARNLLGGLTLLPLIVFFSSCKKRTLPPDASSENGTQSKTLWAGGILCGIALFAASALQQIGIQYTTVGKAGFITALYIVLVPVCGLFLRKRVQPKVWLAVLIAVAGLYLLCMTDGSFSLQKGDLLVLACALGFTIHILVIDHFSPLVDGIKMSCIQFFTCSILSAVCMALFETVNVSNLLHAWIPILYAGFLSSGVGYTLQIIGQKGLNPTMASLLMSLESVFSVLAGWIFLHQALSGRELSGCILMFAAIVLVQLPGFSKTSAVS
ncbi:MAG TPA: DMT family transporter, partial [Fusicatenibacter saccharivorans]|nr:DMT family transporter [Fusicatenibacter saccharivorans]